MGKSILKSALIGGCYGVFVELLYAMYRAIWPTTNYVTALALLTGGLVIGILYVLGIVQKIEPQGGFGTIIPLIGVTSMVAARLNESRKKEKKIFVDAFWSGSKPSMLMLISGIIVSIVISRLALNAIGPGNALAVASPHQQNIFVEIVMSFVFMAIIGAIGQLLLVTLKPNFNGVMVILFAFYVCGAFLAAFGIMQALVVMGPGGMSVPIIDAGEFVFTSLWIPEPGVTFTRLVVFSGLIGSQYMWGAIAAGIRGKMHPEEIS